MNKHVKPKKAKANRGADRIRSRKGKPPPSEAQRRRDRRQVGVAARLAAEAERLFPALRAGVMNPKQIAEQARHVLDKAKLRTERQKEGNISKGHAGNMRRSVRRFAEALDRLGVKVTGLLSVKQSHYIQVMKLWEKQPPGEASRVVVILSHVRRIFTVIGRPDVIPLGDRNTKLLGANGIGRGSRGGFLVNTYLDWASAGLNEELIYEAMTRADQRVAAKMIYCWGMSLREVATWPAVNPDECSFVHVEGHRRSRRGDAEFSLDPAFAAKQRSAIAEAWDYCRQQDRPSICPPDLSPKRFAAQLRMSIVRALHKQFPDRKDMRLTPMKLGHAFFCRVFHDYAGMSLQQARRNPELAQKDRRLGVAWNEAKYQIGVQGAKAARAHEGMPLNESQSIFIARTLRSLSPDFATLRVCDVWVGNGDISAGKCLFVQLLEGAQAGSVARLQELIQRVAVVKLRVVDVQGAGDVPEGAVRVMLRPVPVSTQTRITALDDQRRILCDHLHVPGVCDRVNELAPAKDSVLS